MTWSVVLTGATGFVGGAVALELLAQTDAILICLVRRHLSPAVGWA